MIYKNKHFMLATFQIMTPYFESFDNSSKLIVVDLVLSFYRNHFSQKKFYQVLLTKIGFYDYFIKITFRS